MKTKLKKGSVVFIFIMLSNIVLMAQSNLDARTRSFDSDWRFKLDTISTGPEQLNYDVSDWRIVDLPHDWSVEDVSIQKEDSIVGPFFRNSSGTIFDGFTYGGIGWYRKSFDLRSEDVGKKLFIQFDGVYMNSKVWINGHYLGVHPYGYTPFNYELTPYLNTDGTKNVITVRVENTGKNSRWYAGSGIYRHVKLTAVDPLHIDIWGVNITTPEVNESLANVHLTTTITNGYVNAAGFVLHTEILDAKGKVVGKSKSKVNSSTYGKMEIRQEITIKSPLLWSAETPNLYTAKLNIIRKTEEVDNVSIPFGVRKIKIDAQNGLLVNGKSVFLKGGCIHHDNGPLGAISIKQAEERKVRLLKENGFNAIRISHNPPSEILLEVCDRLGMYVVDEAFDAWEKTKFIDDYHLYFKDCWERDLTSMILRDRNHPSVILWSIGNEIRERASERGLEITDMLAKKVKKLDSTRFVTEAVCDFWDARRTYNWEEHTPAIFDLLDIGGYNYMFKKYESDHKKYPNRIMLGTESYPAKSYENWTAVEENPYIIGDFVWTAMDYRGEAGIGVTSFISGKQKKIFVKWPWFNAFCGDLDFIGNKKPQSYYRDVVWDNSPMEMMVQKLSIPEGMKYYVSDWGWPDEQRSWSWPGSEGDTLLVRVYSKVENVKLELNGKVIDAQEIPDSSITAGFQLPYVPGTLVAKGYINGKEVASTTIKTVGKPVAIRLKADKSNVKANGNELFYVAVEIVDEEGNVVPYVNDIEVNYSIKGEGVLAGVGNGNPTDISSFQQLKKKVYQGKGLVILRSNSKKGRMILEASAEELGSDSITIQVQ